MVIGPHERPYFKRSLGSVIAGGIIGARSEFVLEELGEQKEESANISHITDADTSLESITSIVEEAFRLQSWSEPVLEWTRAGGFAIAIVGISYVAVLAGLTLYDHLHEMYQNRQF